MKYNICQSTGGLYSSDGDYLAPVSKGEVYFHSKILEIKELPEKDNSGDLEFIKYQVNKILSD